MSLSVAGRAVPPQLAPTMAQPRVIPPVATQLSPLMQVYGSVFQVMPRGVVAPPPVAPAPAAPTLATRSVDPLKLCELKDPKAFIDNWDLIQYYLCVPEFSMGCMDDALVTDSTNLEASCMWEGQLCLAVKDGLLHYLFENKGGLYNGRDFEMLEVLSQHCRPDLVANAFTSLLLLFNNVQGNNEPILQYLSCFDGIIIELLRCKVAIPQILMVMLFLRAIHSHYSDLLYQFCTCFKSIKTATINSIVDDIVYHDGFTVHERKTAKTPASAPRRPATASANMDQKGTVWQMPFEWLSKSFRKNAIKTHWICALAGTGICPICHCEDKPWHVPTKCPLLKELNLQLDVVPSGPATQPAMQQSADTPVPALSSHGGCASGMDDLLASGSSGSGTTPSVLMALASNSLPCVSEYDSDEGFCWAGNVDGLDYGVVTKSKLQFAGYMPSLTILRRFPLLPWPHPLSVNKPVLLQTHTSLSQTRFSMPLELCPSL
jgi:hypothetical protein